jgi:hypothetical protein
MDDEYANWRDAVDFWLNMASLVQEKFEKKSITKAQRDDYLKSINESRHETFLNNHPLLKNNQKLKELTYGLF